MEDQTQQIPTPQPPPQSFPPAGPASVEGQPPKSFGWLKWVLIVVLVALLSSGATYLVLQSQTVKQATIPSPSPTPSPSEVSTKEGDLTANWKTYTNTKYEFSVKYPPDLVVSEPSAIRLTNEASMPQVIPDKYVNILIFVRSVEPQTDLRGWIEKDTIRKKPDGTTGSIVVGIIENYQFGDLQGFTYRGGAEVDVKHVLFKKGDKIFDFTLDCYETGCSYKDNPDAERIFNQILSTFKFLDQTQTNVDESRVRELISNFYQAFEKQEGELLFGYMTPPITSQEKGEYSWLIGANLGSDAFYRAFLRVKLSNPSVKNVRRLDDKTYEINATDEFQSYSQVSTQWSEPTIRNVKFTVIKTQLGWLIDKFTYTGTIIWTYKGTEKYNGFPNLDSN